MRLIAAASYTLNLHGRVRDFEVVYYALLNRRQDLIMQSMIGEDSMNTHAFTPEVKDQTLKVG